MATVQQMDYYAILNVPRTADDKAIKAAFRKLARKHHPDVNQGDKSAEERFKQVNEAYEVLSDSANRKLYDRYGDDWRRYKEAGFTGDEPAGQPFTGGGGQPSGWYPGGAPGGSRVHFETSDTGEFGDLFQSLFTNRRGGFTSGRPPRQKGEDLDVSTEITIEEAFTGSTRRLDLRAPVTCTTCGGAGFVRNAPCPTCDGSGTVLRTRSLEVKIPAGVRDCARIRVAGQGGPGTGGAPNGDVFLRVSIHSSDAFTREGDNLRTEIDVPLYTAILGGEVVVPTPTGKLALTIPAESQNGRVFRLRGQGMPTGKSGDPRGDLYAKIRVNVPTNLTEHELELFSELSKLRGRPAD